MHATVIIGACFLVACAPHTGILRTSDAILKAAANPETGPAEIHALAPGLTPSGLSESRIKKYSDEALARALKALAAVTFYFPEDETRVLLQERLLEDKIARKPLPSADIKEMYRTFLGARMFEKAKEIRARFPEIRFYSMPEKVVEDEKILGENRWRAYGVPDDGKTIELKTLPLAEGPGVVMIMNPGCAMSEKAMSDILASEELAPYFRHYGIVLTKRLNAESVALWKTHFKFPSVHIAYKASDFPGFDFRISPHFYFLKDGEIVFSHKGWGGADHLEKNVAALKEGLGLLSVFKDSPR
jgi:hypothetical protein